MRMEFYTFSLQLLGGRQADKSLITDIKQAIITANGKHAILIHPS